MGEEKSKSPVRAQKRLRDSTVSFQPAKKSKSELKSSPHTFLYAVIPRCNVTEPIVLPQVLTQVTVQIPQDRPYTLSLLLDEATTRSDFGSDVRHYVWQLTRDTLLHEAKTKLAGKIIQDQNAVQVQEPLGRILSKLQKGYVRYVIVITIDKQHVPVRGWTKYELLKSQYAVLRKSLAISLPMQDAGNVFAPRASSSESETFPPPSFPRVPNFGSRELLAARIRTTEHSPEPQLSRGVINAQASSSRRSQTRPSEAMLPKQYNAIQSSGSPLYDGRFALDASDTRAPFIGLYEDIFVEFIEYANTLRTKYTAVRKRFQASRDPEDEEGWTTNYLLAAGEPEPAKVEAEQEDEEGFQDDKEGLQHDEEGLQHDEEGLQHDEEGLQHDEEGLQHDEEGLQHDEEGLQHDEEGLQHDDDQDKDWEYDCWVWDLMVQLAKTEAVGQPEQRCQATVEKLLEKLLGCEIGVTHVGTGIGDCTQYLIQSGGLTLVIEIKAELGIQGDPSVQASFVWRVATQDNHDSDSVLYTRSPTFILSIAGSNISVSGAAMTCRPIIQRLTPFTYTAYAAYPTNDDLIRDIACTFRALRHCLNKLRHMYNSLPLPTQPKCDLELVEINDTNFQTAAHPRFFPWPQSFIFRSQNGMNSMLLRVAFRYEYPLTTSASCVTFRVVVISPPVDDPHPKRDHKYRSIPFATVEQLVGIGLPVGTTLVVKFVRDYGVDCHVEVRDVMGAPTLYSYNRFELMGGYRGLKMAVMAFVDGIPLDTLPNCEINTMSQLAWLEKSAKDLVLIMNDCGAMHGDLRASNFVVVRDPERDPGDRDLQVMLVDFDIAFVRKPGMPDFATYPPWYDRGWLFIGQASEHGRTTAAGQKEMLKWVLEDLHSRFSDWQR